MKTTNIDWEENAYLIELNISIQSKPIPFIHSETKLFPFLRKIPLPTSQQTSGYLKIFDQFIYRHILPNRKITEGFFVYELHRKGGAVAFAVLASVTINR